MIRFIKILSLLFIFSVANAQEVTVKTDKAEYKMGERIYLEYEVKAKVDSTGKLPLMNFTIANGPNTSSSISIINGQTTYTYRLNYVINAQQTGNIEIKSPIFFIKNEKQKAESIHIKITGENLTEKEIDQIKFDEFRESLVKPEGTLRFVLSDKYGYVEEFKNNNWVQMRRMTKKEIAKFRKK